ADRRAAGAADIWLDHFHAAVEQGGEISLALLGLAGGDPPGPRRRGEARVAGESVFMQGLFEPTQTEAFEQLRRTADGFVRCPDAPGVDHQIDAIADGGTDRLYALDAPVAVAREGAPADPHRREAARDDRVSRCGGGRSIVAEQHAGVGANPAAARAPDSVAGLTAMPADNVP